MIILFLDLMESSGDNGCNCTKPCHRVSHDAVLGAAQLSQFNVDQIQKEDTHMSRRIKQQFITAREAAQRVDADKADTNKDLFLHFLDSLQNSTEVIVSTLNYWKRETLNDTFFYRAEIMLEDNTLLLERHNEIRLLFTDIYFDFLDSDWLEPSITDFTDSSTLHTFLQGCSSDLGGYPSVTAGECTTKLNEKLETASDLNVTKTVEFLSELRNRQEAAFTSVLTNSASSEDNVISNVPEYSQCKLLLNDLTNAYVPSIQEIETALDNFVGAETYTELVDNVALIEDNLVKLENYSALRDEIRGACWWSLVFAFGLPYNTADMGKLHNSLNSDTSSSKVNRAIATISDVQAASYQSFMDALDHLSDSAQSFENLRNGIRSYTEENITLLDLGAIATNESIRVALNVLVMEANNIVPLINDYESSISGFIELLQDVYSDVFDMILPVINEVTVPELYLVQEATRTGRELRQPLYDKDNYNTMIADLIGLYVTELARQRDFLIAYVPEVQFAVEALVGHLHEYMESCEITHEFYMYVLTHFIFLLIMVGVPKNVLEIGLI